VSSVSIDVFGPRDGADEVRVRGRAPPWEDNQPNVAKPGTGSRGGERPRVLGQSSASCML
jgi:hypothetical protein